MIVCDICTDIHKPATRCSVALIKHEKKKDRETDREIGRVSVDLCEDCIGPYLSRLHRVKELKP